MSAHQVLRDMWTTRRNEAESEIRALIDLLESLAESPENHPLRSSAQLRAHQLVGVFGVFGFAELKTEMARIDIDLSDPSVPVADLLTRIAEILASLP